MADTAVVEKVSGKPGGGPMLQGENLKEFASAIAGQGGDEQAPAPAEAGAPAEPTPEESAQEVSEVAPPPAAAPKAAPKAPVSDDEPKGPIPYDRFKEVNEQLRAERAQAVEYKANESKRIQEAANASAATTLFKIAEEHPELAPLIFRGEKPTPKQPARDPNAPPLTPEQQQAQAIEEIKTQNRALMNWKEQTEKAKILENIQDRAEEQIAKHPIFQNKAVRDLGEQLIVKEILTKPNVSPEVIVDYVAKSFTDLEASIKAEYREKKQVTARTVVPGVGAGSPPAAPAKSPLKLKIADGSALKALASALAAAQASS